MAPQVRPKASAPRFSLVLITLIASAYLLATIFWPELAQRVANVWGLVALGLLVSIGQVLWRLWSMQRMNSGSARRDPP